MSCVFHDPLVFPLPFFVARRIALILQFFTSAKATIHLDAAVLVVQVKWHQGVAALLHFADQFADFLGFQKQLACARGIGVYVGGSGWQRADVHPDDPNFAIAYDNVAFFQLHIPAPYGFDFTAFKDEARLVALLTEVRSEAPTSELQSLMRNSYALFSLKTTT